MVLLRAHTVRECRLTGLETDRWVTLAPLTLCLPASSPSAPLGHTGLVESLHETRIGVPQLLLDASQLLVEVITHGHNRAGPRSAGTTPRRGGRVAASIARSGQSARVPQCVRARSATTQ